MNPMELLRRYSVLVLLLAAYLLMAVTYSVVNPLFESPDEIWHYEYVRWLVEGNGLPEPEDVGHAPWHQEGSQPPLYYLTAAALTALIPTDDAAEVIRYNPHAAVGQADAFGNKNIAAHDQAQSWPWRATTLAAHLARFYSVLMGALTVAFTFLTARALFPWRPAVAGLAGAMVAFNPQFLFISAAVNNDNLVAATCAAGVWLLSVIFVQRPPSIPNNNDRIDQASPKTWQLVTLGLLVGIAALSKLSGLFLAVYVGLVLIVVAIRMRTFWGLVRWGLIIGAVAAVVAGWWYLRNMLVFGDPLLLSAMFAILPKRAEPPTMVELMARLEGVWRSFWAVWGWFNVVAEPWLYRVYNWLTLLGIVGLFASLPLQRLYRRRASEDGSTSSETSDKPSDGETWLRIGLLVLWVLLIAMLLLYWAQMRYPQGRLLFPAISAFAVLMAYGLTGWLPQSLQRGVAVVVAVAMLVLAALVPFRWIAPTYAAPIPLPVDIQAPNEMEATFGDQFQLRGYEFGEVELRPGDVLDLALYWQALQPLGRDYSIFIHLTDGDQLLQAQQDSFPGAGNGPTLNWSTDVVWPDNHRVTIPEAAPSPSRLKVDVGVYDHGSGERLLVGGYDHWTLGYVTLLAPEDESGLPHAMNVNFGDQIALRGFEFGARSLNPGDSLPVTLWWEALTELDINYTVFVHLVLPPESTWAQRDDTPLDGSAPTTTWIVGEQMEDHYELQLPDEAPPGVYFVEVGIFERATNDRLKVNFSEKGVVLGQVRVEEK
jgi:4-amino-4-deoxy-L-arabinose transferase-like glycosyltransferase